MPVCPKCNHDWPTSPDRGTETSSQRLRADVTCPKCGNVFSEMGQVDDDPFATLPSLPSTGAQTVVEGLLTVDEAAGAATIDVSTITDSSLATLDISAVTNPSTNSVDMESKALPPVQPVLDATSDTGGSSPLDHSSQSTIDISAGSYHSLLNDVDRAGPDATHQFDPLATANFGMSVSGDATLDSSASQSQTSPVDGNPGGRNPAENAAGLTAKVAAKRTRSGTVPEDSPLTSIGTDASSKSIKHVSVSNRKLSSSDQAVVENADYRLLHKLGEGAMGVVYAARQCSIDRIVAIKAIKKANEGQRDSREKFLYEAQITGDLDHPNIVPIHELGENDDGTLFYAMKMVSGTPWQKVIAGRSREDNVETLMKVADAIAFAHSKRVIHRDLKPENIMLGSFGEVLVMDWGLAVPLDRNVPFGLGGTPAYMAPEMASHNVAKIGPASDIYLLGAILFQIVTGVPPHPGNTGTECLMAAVRNRFVDISSDDALLTIARKAMESEPSNRYASVQEFQEAIRQYKRHAESIAITGRSRAQAVQARQTQNYVGFARAIFGFQDALVLWKDNLEAQQECQKAKLEYARCALAKSDFDLCLSTLEGIEEPCVADAEQLRAQAQQAKQAQLDKERRFVILRRALAGVVLFAVTSLSGLSIFLYSARSTILTQNSRLERQRNDLAAANQAEQIARVAAESAQATAEAAAKSELEARKLAENSLKAEQAAREQREIALRNEQAAKAEEVKQRMLAQASAEEATQARNAEALAAQAARRSALLARLGEYQTGLNLAMTQTERFDVLHSQQQLQLIANLEKTLEQPAPVLTNWLYRRVQTLNNVDLPRIELDTIPTCASSWPWLNRIALGDQSGHITLLDVVDHTLIKRHQLSDEPGRIVDVALAPNGQQLVSLHERTDGSFKNLFWNLTDNQPSAPQPLKELARHALQQCEFSPDGRYLVAGNSGGLAVWAVNAQGPQELKRLPMKGQLLSLAWQPGPNSDTALALVRQTSDDCLLYRVQLKGLQCEPLALSHAESRMATCVALTAHGVALLGDAEGRVFELTLPSGPANSQTPESKSEIASVLSTNELPSAEQPGAVRSLQADNNDHVIVLSDAPLVTTLQWQTAQGQWDSSHTLLGLSGDTRAAGWTANSQALFAIDQRGTGMLWNLALQEQRVRSQPRSLAGRQRVNAAPVVHSAIDESSGWITTMDRDGALQRWQLRSGQVDQLPDGGSWSYVGHTPGGLLHDWSVDLQQHVLATCCRLPATAALDKLPPRKDMSDQSPNFEICLWDLQTGSMRMRRQLALSSGGRMALAHAAQKLLITDADRTLCFDIASGFQGAPSVLAFGAALVLPNPLANHQVMLVRATGASLIWDVSQGSTSVPESSKDFNLAAANRFVPLDGYWDRTGRRCYCLLENGQLARYLWDGRTLTFDRLSAPVTQLACNQQQQPWQSVDIEPGRGTGQPNTSDECIITIRQRPSAGDSMQRVSSCSVSWSLSAPEPTLTPQPVLASVLPSGAPAVDLCRLSDTELLLFDPSGAAFRTTVTGNELRDSFGRTEQLAASADASGKRWALLGQHNQLWLAERAGDSQVNWRRLRVPHRGLNGVAMSANGEYLLVSHQYAQSQGVSMIELKSDSLIQHWPGTSSMTWHPQTLQFACVDNEQNGLLVYDLAAQQEERIPLVQARNIQQLQFFQEAWSSANSAPRWWLMLIQNSDQKCRIEFQCAPDRMQAEQWRNKPLNHALSPLVLDSPTRQVHASPTENILAIGDASGAVSLWFACPTIAPEARELTTLQAHRSSSICDLRFSQQGNVLFTAAENREVFAWPTISVSGP